MSAAQRRKGKRAELDAVRAIHEATGWPVARALREGRRADAGDIVGCPDWCVQVKAYATVAESVQRGMAVIDRQQAAAGCRWGVVLVRLVGGRFLAVMHELQWHALVDGEVGPPTRYGDLLVAVADGTTVIMRRPGGRTLAVMTLERWAEIALAVEAAGVGGS